MPYYEGALLKASASGHRERRSASRYGSSPVESATEMFEEGDRVRDRDGDVAVVVEVKPDGLMVVDRWPSTGNNHECVQVRHWTHA